MSGIIGDERSDQFYTSLCNSKLTIAGSSTQAVSYRVHDPVRPPFAFLLDSMLIGCYQSRCQQDWGPPQPLQQEIDRHHSALPLGSLQMVAPAASASAAASVGACDAFAVAFAARTVAAAIASAATVLPSTGVVLSELWQSPQKRYSLHCRRQ